MIGIQLFGIVVGLAAIHLTHLYYKRAHFSKRELFFWIGSWGAFMAVSLFPGAISPAVSFFGLARPMDLIMIIAFIVLLSLAFHNYVMGRKHGRDLERLVREIALQAIDKE